MRRHTFIVGLAVLALAGTACTSASPDDPDGPAAAGANPIGFATSPGDDVVDDGSQSPGTGDPDLPMAQFVGLQAVGSCDALLDQFVDNAVELVTPWGLGGGGGVVVFDAATEAAAGSDGGGEASFDSGVPLAGIAQRGNTDDAYSTTNVQEGGVDEPDTVKTDGELLITVVEDRIQVVDLGSAEVVGTVQLDDQAWGGQLLLAGDDLLVLSTNGGSWSGPADGRFMPAFRASRTIVTRIDLADPTDPQIVGRATIEGSYRSARMVDGTVRLVIESEPTGLALTFPEDGGLEAEQAALEENRRLLRESELDDWIPHVRFSGPDGQSGDVEPLLACDQIAQPAEFAGFQTLSVLTLAIDEDTMAPSSAAGLVASGETVYASADRLVVATSPWGQWREPFMADDGEVDETPTTQLHSFDIQDPAATTYVASAQVDGTLLNQFSLSEVDGILRAATTTQPSWWGGDEKSQSSLVVFQEQDGDLVEVGRVDGLGVTEQIHSVRYLSPDLAAIVTFRQTDPLYLVDTSDPTTPSVAGELKIPGVSTYLHPIGDGMLLGVGQDADDEGRTNGLQLSLFDISDISDPQRVDNLVWKNGSSPAEYDHHAFLHWGPTGQVVLPMEVWEDFEEEPSTDGDPVEPRRDEPFLGAVVVSVDGDELVRDGTLTQDGSDGSDENGRSAIQRTIVVGEDLWTLGWDSLARHDFETLDHEALLRLQ